jgi:hypothetical protein
MDPTLKPRPKIKAAATTAGGISLVAIVALLFGADPDDPVVQAVAVLVASGAPVLRGYLKRDSLSRP